MQQDIGLTKQYYNDTKQLPKWANQPIAAWQQD